MTAPSPEQLSPAVFLDRDGTLMRDVEYCDDPKRVVVFPGVIPALQQLKARGFKLVVITNQSGIGRGYFNEVQYRAVERELDGQLGAGLLDATYFCPDKPDAGCRCRKPEPGLVLDAQRDHAIDLTQSFFVGDKAIDIECGRRVGLRTVLVQTGQEPETSGADWIACDMQEAAEIILQHAI